LIWVGPGSGRCRDGVEWSRVRHESVEVEEDEVDAIEASYSYR
jgi:hypothetical protein